MNTRNEHDEQLLELVAVWKKLSAWNKTVVFCFAVQAVAIQKLKSFIGYLLTR